MQKTFKIKPKINFQQFVNKHRRNESTTRYVLNGKIIRYAHLDLFIHLIIKTWIHIYRLSVCTLTRQLNSKQIVPIQFWTKLSNAHSATFRSLLLLYWLTILTEISSSFFTYRFHRKNQFITGPKFERKQPIQKISARPNFDDI